MISDEGKSLVSKCKALLEENRQLGQQMSQEEIERLEAELSDLKSYGQELQASQKGTIALMDLAPILTMDGHVLRADRVYFNVG